MVPVARLRKEDRPTGGRCILKVVNLHLDNPRAYRCQLLNGLVERIAYFFGDTLMEEMLPLDANSEPTQVTGQPFDVVRYRLVDRSRVVRG